MRNAAAELLLLALLACLGPEARGAVCSGPRPCPPRGLNPFVPDLPPKAALIQLSDPNANGIVTVTGSAGAAQPNAWLLLLTLDTGHFTSAQAGADGSFTAAIFAPRGTSIMIKSDPAGVMVPGYIAGGGPAEEPGNALLPMAGAILRVPDHDPNDPNAFAGAAPVRMGGLPVWTFAGRTSARQLDPGGTLTLSGTFTLLSTTSFPTGEVQTGLLLERLSEPDGTPVMAQSTFASSTMTPTGLPIERLPDWFSGLLVQGRSPLASAGDTFQAAVELTLRLPADLLPGYYIPCAVLYTDELTEKGGLAARIDGANRRPLISSVYGPVVRVGAPAPPRLAWTLLNDDLYNGVRGVASAEDRGKFALSTRMRLPTDFTIVPRLDPRSGEPLTYRLEPFAPSLSLGDQGVAPNPPPIAFRFPSGELRVTITRPDASRRTIGPAPLVQMRVRGEGNRPGTPYEFGGHASDMLQLSTMRPEFEVTFDRDGLHRIRLDGFVEDRWGNRWEIADTYDVYVGRVLAFEPSTLPGTPFIAGDTLSVAGNIMPPVPADVTLTFTHSSGVGGEPVTTRTVVGRANRFGYYDLGEPIPLTAAGEYRVDITLRYSSPDGSWFGGRTWGGVIAPPNSPIIAHGRRGTMSQTEGNAQWFRRTQVNPPDFLGAFPFPFQSGDVMWQADHPEGGADTVVSFQDTSGTAVPLFEARCHPCPLLHPPSIGEFDERAAIGETPLFSRGADYIDPHINPSSVDLWGYAYRFSERPAVGVRELIGEDSIQTTNWYLIDRYGLQLGNGVHGDRANDFKFQFGGVVIRGSAVTKPLYAAYGSLFVITSEDDHLNDRIMPPFQGNGGGPSGGPLFKLKGKAVDLFFLPTGVRAGTILQPGQLAAFSGHVAPLLPAKVEITVTSPAGVVRTIEGRANQVGYFYDPGSDFRVDESGVWKAKVVVTFDGVTSAGQVTPPYPTGGVLGSREGEFDFYVVPGDAAPLDVGPMPRFVRPADGPLTFTITPPPGLTDVTVDTTTIMPGYILEQRTNGGSTYTYDARTLAADYPNLDLVDEDGRAGVDIVTMSFFAGGNDAEGRRRCFARQITLLGEELIVPEEEPSPPRQRAVRK